MLHKMNINKFRDILEIPQIDEFTNRTFDGAAIALTIHQAPFSNKKYFVLHGGFQVYGWTEDANKAFDNFHNMSVFTVNEFYEGLRGRKV